MKNLTLLALVISFNVSATPVTTNITSVMNGSVMVGTNVSAGVGQSQAQTSTATLTGSSTLSVINAVPTVANSITGTASSVATGNGYTSPSWNIVDSNGVTQGVSAISTGSVVTTIVDYPITPSTIVSNGHDHD